MAVPLVLAALKPPGAAGCRKRFLRRGIEPFALGAVAIAIILNVAFLAPLRDDLGLGRPGPPSRPDAADVRHVAATSRRG